VSHTHYNNLDFSSFSSRNRILETSMGPSADPLFPYPPPNDHKLALAQAPFATRESGIKTLDSPFSKHRYPRYYTGMAPSSLAPATCNRRLGQTLAPLATSPVEVLSSSCSSFANPRDARGQCCVDSAKAMHTCHLSTPLYSAHELCRRRPSHETSALGVSRP
jgi:hypothetical protein